MYVWYFFEEDNFKVLDIDFNSLLFMIFFWVVFDVNDRCNSIILLKYFSVYFMIYC